jgi:Bacterial RNA polymerase, alpha chain C terminal domain/Sigma-70, region 4
LTGDNQTGVDQSVSRLELDRFDLSTRTLNCLRSAGIATVGILTEVKATDILGWPKAGQKTLGELRELMGRLGLKLSGDPGALPRADPKLLREFLTEAEQTEVGDKTHVVYLKTAESDVQRRLVTRVKQIPLSTRAQNVLVQAEIIFVGELAQLTYYEILRLQNCGRCTADELAKLVEGHDLSLGSSIPDWSRERALELADALARAIAQQARKRSQTLLESVAPDPIFLEDELARILQSVSNGRNSKILTSLWGWNGEVYRTLESVGGEFGITRERVRQIEAGALRRLEKHHFQTPFLQSAITLLKKEAPGIDAELSKKIRESGISRDDFNIWSLIRAAEIFNERSPFERVNIDDNRLLVLADDEPQLSGVLSIVRRKTAELGCTNVLSLASELKMGQRRCVAAGMNATTFYIYRMGSPVISALGKGIYCKVGCEVPPGTIEGIVARRRSVTRVSDHGWTPSGCLWFGVELTRQIITAGGIRLAPFVSDLVQGEWKVSLPDGTDYGDVTCRDVFIWSFRNAFAVLGAERGDLVTFEFDLKSRKVLVRVGGPGLFEAIQDHEGVGAADSAEET